jgi:hypothetical protein
LKTYKKNPSPVYKLLVLIPHRDVRVILRKWSASLFKAGFCGAYSFPWVVPLAILSKSFSHEELKHCALALRESTLRKNNDGKIRGTEAAYADFPVSFNSADSAQATAGSVLLGPKLDFAIADEVLSGDLVESTGSKITHIFSPLLIGSCLLPSCTNPADSPGDTIAIPALPPISFRAAAVANMRWKELSSDSLVSHEWKIRKPCWLPSVRNVFNQL